MSCDSNILLLTIVLLNTAVLFMFLLPSFVCLFDWLFSCLFVCLIVSLNVCLYV